MLAAYLIAMSGAPAQDEQRLSGLTIEQYAGVTTALREELPLEAILAQEQIEPSAWEHAERVWREAIGNAPDLHLQLIQAQRVAEDSLARKIDPLSDDPAAWAGLLGALAISDSPMTVLGPLGLNVNDLGRLGRQWKRKVSADPKLAQELAAHAGKAPAPTNVRVEPVALKPFPWTPKPKESSVNGPRGLAEARAGVLPIATDVDLYAAFCVVLEIMPAERQTALDLVGLHESAVADIELAWRQRLTGDPDLRAEYAVKMVDYRVGLRRLLLGARPLREISSGVTRL